MTSRLRQNSARLARAVVIAVLAAQSPATLGSQETPTTAPATAPAATQPSAAQIVATELVKVIGQNAPAQRRQAVTAILEAGSSEGIQALRTVLAAPNNEDAKLAICQILADTQRHEEAFIEPLLALLDDPRPQLHETAADALAAYDDPQVVARLRRYRHAQERALMIAQITALMETLYEQTSEASDRVALLLDWLDSPLALQRFEAIQLIHEGLRRTGAKPVEEVLAKTQALLHDPDEKVRQELVTMLRDLGRLEDVPRLRQMVTDEPSPSVREEIYKALGKLREPASIPTCLNGLNDPSETAAAAAADALGRLCEKENGKLQAQVLDQVAQTLLQRLGAPIRTDRLRTDVYEAMAAIADPRFLPPLVEAAKSETIAPAIRQAAVRGIGRIGDPTPLELVLTRLTTDANAGVREVAATAIGELAQSAEVLAPLKARLDPKTEASTAVQNKAWGAYQKVYLRLPATEQIAVAATWASTDAKAVARRIDLLVTTQAALDAAEARDSDRATVFEQLGDAHLLAGSTDQAVSAWQSALELTTDDTEDRARLFRKMIDAWLKAGAIDSAITQASVATAAEVRQAAGNRLLEYGRQLHNAGPASADAFIAQLSKTVPDLFGGELAAQFKSLQPAATQPTAAPQPAAGTQPAPAETQPTNP